MVNTAEFPPGECIDLLGTLDARDDRRRADRESQKRSTKENKFEHPDEADANRNSIPRVLCKKQKPKPVRGKQHETASHRITKC